MLINLTTGYAGGPHRALAMIIDKKYLLLFYRGGTDTEEIKQRRTMQMDKDSLRHGIARNIKYLRPNSDGKYKADIGKI